MQKAIRRISYEVRGLKFRNRHDQNVLNCSRISYEVRGLKSADSAEVGTAIAGRISYEVRGLKFAGHTYHIEYSESHLIRGAWIEII